MTNTQQLIDGPSTFAVAHLAIAERIKQDAKWGQQNHPDGTGPDTMPLYDIMVRLDDTNTAKQLADKLTKRTDERFAGRRPAAGSWRDILLEEVFEALAESDPEALGEELIQVAAVALAWVEAIGRRNAINQNRSAA